MPAEFPGTSFNCISICPKRYSFLDWKPEPEALSRESVSTVPFFRICPRPSPHVISKSRVKLVAETSIVEHANSTNASNIIFTGKKMEEQGEEDCIFVEDVRERGRGVVFDVGGVKRDVSLFI